MMHDYLLQRLRKPLGVVNPFSFGGGGSRLSREAEDLVSRVWCWDYMGASQYEFGKAQKALSSIYEYVNDSKGATSEISIKKNPVYYLCRKNDEKEVIGFIKSLYKNKNDLRLRDPSYFREHLEGKGFAKDIVGWFEFNNHFIFFSDKEMYEKSLELFQYKRENGNR